MMEAEEIVGPHQPHEMDTRAAAFHVAERLECIGTAEVGLETRDHDLGMTGELAGRLQALGEFREVAPVLQWITGADEPPDAIEPQTP